MDSITLRSATGGCVNIDGDRIDPGLYLIDGRLYLHYHGKKGRVIWRDCETGQHADFVTFRRTGYKMEIGNE
jgi:hypothetical protein